MILFSYYHSPLGMLALASKDDRLVLCDWITRRNGREFLLRVARQLDDRDVVEGRSQVIMTAEKQLDEYFSGRRKCFELQVELTGTPFQQAVWCALSSVGYGYTATYGEIAHAAGRPEAVRAVANAIGANRLSIIIPCHRITGCDNPGGYAGGRDIKQGLLLLERRFS